MYRKFELDMAARAVDLGMDAASAVLSITGSGDADNALAAVTAALSLPAADAPLPDVSPVPSTSTGEVEVSGKAALPQVLGAPSDFVRIFPPPAPSVPAPLFALRGSPRGNFALRAPVAFPVPSMPVRPPVELFTRGPTKLSPLRPLQGQNSFDAFVSQHYADKKLAHAPFATPPRSQRALFQLPARGCNSERTVCTIPNSGAQALFDNLAEEIRSVSPLSPIRELVFGDAAETGNGSHADVSVAERGGAVGTAIVSVHSGSTGTAEVVAGGGVGSVAGGINDDEARPEKLGSFFAMPAATAAENGGLKITQSIPAAKDHVHCQKESSSGAVVARSPTPAAESREKSRIETASDSENISDVTVGANSVSQIVVEGRTPASAADVRLSRTNITTGGATNGCDARGAGSAPEGRLQKRKSSSVSKQSRSAPAAAEMHKEQKRPRDDDTRRKVMRSSQTPVADPISLPVQPVTVRPPTPGVSLEDFFKSLGPPKRPVHEEYVPQPSTSGQNNLQYIPQGNRATHARSPASESGFGSDTSRGGATFGRDPEMLARVKEINAMNRAAALREERCWASRLMAARTAAYSLKHDVIAMPTTSELQKIEHDLLRAKYCKHSVLIIFQHDDHSHVLHECEISAMYSRDGCMCSWFMKRLKPLGDRTTPGHDLIDRPSVVTFFQRKVSLREMTCSLAFVNGEVVSLAARLADVSPGILFAEINSAIIALCTAATGPVENVGMLVEYDDPLEVLQNSMRGAVKNMSQRNLMMFLKVLEKYLPSPPEMITTLPEWCASEQLCFFNAANESMKLVFDAWYRRTKVGTWQDLYRKYVKPAPNAVYRGNVQYMGVDESLAALKSWLYWQLKTDDKILRMMSFIDDLVSARTAKANALHFLGKCDMMCFYCRFRAAEVAAGF